MKKYFEGNIEPFKNDWDMMKIIEDDEVTCCLYKNLVLNNYVNCNLSKENIQSLGVVGNIIYNYSKF